MSTQVSTYHTTVTGHEHLTGFGWINTAYLIEQEMRQRVRNEQFKVYEVAIEGHAHTMLMAGTLFSKGLDDHACGSGNHGSPGGGGSVEAKALGNGKYQVVKGLNDGGNTVYIVDDKGT